MELGKRSRGDQQGGDGLRVSIMQLRIGYMRLEPAAGGSEHEEGSGEARLELEVQRKQQQQRQRQKRKWRFRVRPKVRVLHSTISRLVRRLRDSYARVMRALVASARDNSLLAVGVSKKKRRTAAIGSGSFFRNGSGGSSNFSGVETKYLDYIKRSVADGELSYYMNSLRNSSIV